MRWMVKREGRGILDSKAIIYIASGQQYLDEAARSAVSTNGQYKTIFCTPERSDFYSDSVKVMPARQYDYWYLDCVNYLNIILDLFKYNQFLLLDTDTYVCGDLSDYFKALDRFDIVGTHAVGRETMVQRDNIPASFPELHIGAMAFNRNKRVSKLFNSWLKIYQDKPEYFGDNDQGPLREALWKDKAIKLGILPAEFCFRYRWGGLINGQVRVLHGRENNTPYEEIAKQVNSQNGIRVWHKRELA